jgi:hypothetical protein
MHKAAFTPDNAAMLLIDHQLGTMGWTHSHDMRALPKLRLLICPERSFKRTGCSPNLTHRRGGAVMKLIKKRRLNLERKRHPDKLRHRKLARRVRRSRRGRP